MIRGLGYPLLWAHKQLTAVEQFRTLIKMSRPSPCLEGGLLSTGFYQADVGGGNAARSQHSQYDMCSGRWGGTGVFLHADPHTNVP